MRVVSLLPSATEVLCRIGGTSLLVGRSHECDYPPEVRDVPVLTAPRVADATSAAINQQVQQAAADDAVASLYTIDDALLRSLQPDVILTQDLCNVCSIDLHAVERIAGSMSPQPQIVSLNPQSIEDVFDDMLTVGDAVGLQTEAQRAVVELRDAYWSAVDYVNPYIPGPEIAFLEWVDPLFVGGHWTPQLIQAAGARHSLNSPGNKSRQITPEHLLEVLPDRLIICPCGFAIQRTLQDLPGLLSQRWWPLLPAVQDDQAVVVDGNQMFNRPGPRLVDAFRWLVGWINDRPQLIPADFPVQPVPVSATRV